MIEIAEILLTHNQAQGMAGSGLRKIQHGWTEQGHSLVLYDSLTPYDQTVAELTWGALEKTTQNSSEKTPEKTPEKTTTQILAYVKIDAYVTAGELATAIGKSTSAVERAIAKLKAQNKLRRIGPDKGGYWEIVE